MAPIASYPACGRIAGVDAPLDCLIIGGGPAGLTAATYLGRFRRRIAIIDKGWSRAEWITRAHNVPGFPYGIAGPALIDLMRTQVSKYGAQIRYDTVTTLSRSADGVFTARLSDGRFDALTVLLAAGVVENKPPLAHFADAVKCGIIRTCPICDGYEAIGKRIAVIGSGEHAASEALFLRTYASDVSLLLMASDPASLSRKTLDQLQAAAISLTHVAGGSVHVGAEGFTEISVDDGGKHRFELAYTAFGTTAQSVLATSLGARVDDVGRLVVTEHQRTSIPGLYAAGDVVRGLNQISVADGEAAIAATAIHNYLPRVFARTPTVTGISSVSGAAVV